jgi:predicted RNA-binding Zn-ribbon protein involved in translation (DUF1610 family)
MKLADREIVAAYECPRCGRAAFYLTRRPSMLEAEDLDSVIMPGGARPERGADRRCGVCNSQIFELSLDAVKFPCRFSERSVCRGVADIAGGVCSACIHLPEDDTQFQTALEELNVLTARIMGCQPELREPPRYGNRHWICPCKSREHAGDDDRNDGHYLAEYAFNINGAWMVVEKLHLFSGYILQQEQGGGLWSVHCEDGIVDRICNCATAAEAICRTALYDVKHYGAR